MPLHSNPSVSSHEPFDFHDKGPRGADGSATRLHMARTQDDAALDKFNAKYGRDDDDRGLRRLRRRQAKLNTILMTARIVAEESKKAQVRRNKWKLANAGPIGLLGFGVTTVLLNLHNTGHFSLYSAIPAMGICFGGLAQLFAGLLEFCRANTFGYVAFVSYGAFWLSLVCTWLLPNTSYGTPSEIVASSDYFVGCYMLLWTLFSFMMLCCTIRMNVAIFLVFLTVFLLFLLLTIANMVSDPDTSARTARAAGYEGIVCGCIALYTAFAEVVNEVWDRTILPIIPMTQLLGWFGCGGSNDAVVAADAKARSPASSAGGPSSPRKNAGHGPSETAPRS